MAQRVTSEQYYDLSGQLREIDRQLRQQSGYPFDLAQLKTHLQRAIEGKFEHAAPPVSIFEKFALLVDLGIITVSHDYVHETCLSTFREQDHGGWFCGCDENIADANYPNPSRILKAGDKLRVCAFEQIVDGTTTSQERMAFLEEKQSKNVYVGAQGAALVLEQKRFNLPMGKWYASFDQPDRLWEDPGGNHMVPLVNAVFAGHFALQLGDFKHDHCWHKAHAFLGFSELI